MPKPPIDPDSFDKVNFVIDAWTTGCDAPWYIYVETMKPALLAAFITLVTFGWDDVLRGYFRPRGLYKRRSSKRKRKWTRRLPRFPEVGNTLGKQLPGSTEVRGTKWSSLGKTLWRIDGAMEMVRFFWLVAAITEDFAFDWTSLLFESYWCQDDPPNHFSWHSDTFGIIADEAWSLMNFPIKDYQTAPPFWFGIRGSTGPDPVTVSAGVSVRTRPPFDPPTSIRCVVRNRDTHEIYGDSGTNDELENGEGSVVVSGAVPRSTFFTVNVWMEGTSFADAGDGVVLAEQIVQ
ncbi:MAG TPA: hypothetical protein ENH89_15835 [Aurantimonas coralicida]|uniref:Uncharacterized protein n=1 Tax=Aurantimonas coralicida TaxID=182270 RepID=A0A9C9NHF3_9HYPH|nr:hypothetical protein [Aurantimonas coralicida]